MIGNQKSSNNSFTKETRNISSQYLAGVIPVAAINRVLD